jgi:UDP-N-acetylglucosamine--N-acetylmuramyl-(pentapeptide) pyrophosphoryl-undecaprenol N-acetylglucosamine transferase
MCSGSKPGHQAKVHLVGNPVRAEVIALRDEPFPPFIEDGVFRVLVTGGSQGASILSEVVPDALARLPLNLRRRLQVTQQCRAEDLETVRKTYADHQIPAQLATYLKISPKGWLVASGDRAGRGVDHRRTDLRGPPGDPDSAAIGDGQSSGL